jgi:hypothetical protein
VNRNVSSNGNRWSGPVSGGSFVAGIAGAMALSDAPYPRPGADVETVRRYFSAGARAARVSVAGQLVSAASLSAFTLSVARLAERSGDRGLRTQALAGGAVAAATLVASALASAALTSSPSRDDASTARLHRFVFVVGGAAHNVGLGLLVNSLGRAGARTGELPAGLTRAAAASSTVALLSPLSLAAAPAMVAIPAGRFSGLLIAGLAGPRITH